MTSLPLILSGLFALALGAGFLGRYLGRNAGYVLAAGLGAATAAVAAHIPEVVSGDALEWTAPWAPTLGLRLTLVLDSLSLLFSLIILGIGAVVMAYSARYFKPGTEPGRLYALLTFFAASMLGLVLAGDAALLFVFWELTSIASFFLIGGDGSGSKGAMRAFLVTGIGGLSLFAGLVLLAVVTGSFDVASMLDAGDEIAGSGFQVAIVLLLLGGAFTKSAQVPFHFWLPGAMVAPTPVSTYLHAATMVKAGIYLVARFTPLFAADGIWFYATILGGLVTALFAAVVALKQFDLKALLAYSTVSQLGMLMALVGLGTPHARLAAGVNLVSHALYKATLFMVVGIIDREAGSRDIRELSGLRRAMPLTATAAGLAGLSMAGLPPLLGFVGKEEAFGAFLDAPGPGWLAPVAAALAVAASIVTFAYGARIFDQVFTGSLHQELYEPPRLFLAPPALTAFGGVVLGFGVGLIDPLVGAVAEETAGRPGVLEHAALWHGWTPALALSIVTVTAGTAAVYGRARVARVLDSLRTPVEGAHAFDTVYDSSVDLGVRVGSPFITTAPARHLGWVLASAGGVTLAGWLAFGRADPSPAPQPLAPDWFVVLLLLAACTGVVVSRTRLAATALTGLIGFLVAVFYVLFGAPDLALTQLLVETLTVALIVLVFRRLPQSFALTPRLRRGLAAIAAGALGIAAGAAAYTLTGRRGFSEAAEYFLQAGPRDAGGDNIVNTILVDFRALDTLGEITVLVVAAIGVYILARFSWRRQR